MARPRKATVILASIEECTAAMRKLLLATLDHERATAERDGYMALAMKQYEKRLQTLTEKRQDLDLQLQNYYMTHLGEVERDGKKSVQLQYGVMGRRFGNPSLRLLNKSWTWTAVLVKLREHFGKKFLRLRDPEVDKDKVKTELPEEQLGEYGMKLAQAESFYVDLFRPAEEA